jgi:dipeptidase D
MSSILKLAPSTLWKRFYEMSQIPRPSKKEERITEHFENLFKTHGIPFKKDKTGNLVASVPATRGYAKAPVVVLQGHSDMVCEKNRDTIFDFDKDPIRLLQDGDWVTADGTTLGADNGIGVAAALAIMTDKEAVHGPLEILITVDEETGLTGAKQLSSKMLKGKYLLNLDSEEEGMFYVGCAGGIDTVGIFKPTFEKTKGQDLEAYTLRVSGLKGGHSGCDIHLGRGNAIKLLARVLQALQPLKYQLSEIQGGSKRNAIPREAEALLVLGAGTQVRAQAILDKCLADFKNEYKSSDGGVQLSLEKAKTPAQVYRGTFSQKLIRTLLALPHGVIQMSGDIEGLVETSTNLATVVSDNQQIRIGTSQRSSVDSAKAYIASNVASLFKLASARTEQSDGYPGWQPDMDARLLQICKKVAVQFSGKTPEIKAIHAGLECGLLGGKYPNMQMISFGPTITGAHSPDEKVHAPSVDSFYALLKAILKSLATEG